MTRVPLTHASLLTVLLTASACGPSILVPSDPTPTTGEDEGSSSTAVTPPGVDDSTGAVGTTTAEDEDTGPMPPPATAGSFLDDPDGGGVSVECDVFAQDCPAGEKCMPWANDGGGAWNATRCSPLADNPGDPGDPCTVEGSGASGIDDCALGTMCWDVDPETNMGTCVAMCTGSWDDPTCDDPESSCHITSSGVLNLCLPNCDPIAQDCPEGQACYAVNDSWDCVPDASGDMGAYGDPCEFLNACDPGLLCLGPAATPGCASGVGCCSEICNLLEPQCTGAPEGQECLPWYQEGAAPPQYQHVGACAVPE